MKKVDGNLRISVNVECPGCGEVIDLMKFSKFTDDGWIYTAVLESEATFGCDDLDETMTCPECKTEFEVGAVNW